MSIDCKDICYSISTGQYNQAEINAIANAIRFRRESLLPSFNVGDEVEFMAATKPAYLVGARAIITKVNNKRVKVRMVTPIGRFSHGVTVPKSLLNVIKPAK